MKKIILHVFLLTTFLSCQNKLKEEADKRIKFPKIFNLKLSSDTHAMFLNTKLFSKHELSKNKIGEIKKNIDFEMLKDNERILNNNLSQYSSYDAVKGNDSIKVNLEFECSECSDAFVVLIKANDRDVNSVFKELVSDPIIEKLRIKKIDGIYSLNNYHSLKDGYESLYLIVQDSSKVFYSYELATLLSDGQAPQFIQNKWIESRELESNEGIVAISTEDFSGDDYTGYFVPIKGRILGDVSEIQINGRKVTFKQGDFFIRIKMKLYDGYNQIPLIISDKFGNKTVTYIPLNIGQAIDKPQVKIENNIDINN